jgi:DNA-binding NarL/FixJ family response regulator
MPDRKSVLVVDDHPLYRSGVIRSLEEDPRFAVAGEGASADEAVALAGATQPDVALLDLSMPGNGLEAVRRLHLVAPATRIVVLTV